MFITQEGVTPVLGGLRPGVSTVGIGIRLLLRNQG